MKTTIDISDQLLREAQKLANREGVPLRAIVERGLRHVIAEADQGTPFKLRVATFKGRGLQPEFADGQWEKIRDAIYEGRGS